MNACNTGGAEAVTHRRTGSICTGFQVAGGSQFYEHGDALCAVLVDAPGAYFQKTVDVIPVKRADIVFILIPPGNGSPVFTPVVMPVFQRACFFIPDKPNAFLYPGHAASAWRPHGPVRRFL